jgi:hypothetical protein
MVDLSRDDIQISPPASSSQPAAVDGPVLRQSSSTVPIGSLLCDSPVTNHSPSHSQQGNLLSPVGLQQSVSLYTSPANVSLINLRRAELLHYFKSAVGWPWVGSCSTGATAHTLIIQVRCCRSTLHARSLAFSTDMPTPALCYACHCSYP